MQTESMQNTRGALTTLPPFPLIELFKLLAAGDPACRGRDGADLACNQMRRPFGSRAVAETGAACRHDADHGTVSSYAN